MLTIIEVSISGFVAVVLAIISMLKLKMRNNHEIKIIILKEKLLNDRFKSDKKAFRNKHPSPIDELEKTLNENENELQQNNENKN